MTDIELLDSPSPRDKVRELSLNCKRKPMSQLNDSSDKEFSR